MVPTPHIGASAGEIAPLVLMPGDPLRAKFIAENFLSGARQYNGIRGMLGYTGTFEGVPVSVQGSGMGMPSMGIYSYELFAFYGAEKIIRIGSAGGISPNLKLRDVVLATGACTNSSYAGQYNLPGTFAPVADFELARAAMDSAAELKIPCIAGNILSSDTFYCDDGDALKKWQKMGVLAVEMEAAALYMNAARLNKSALALLTISDLPFTGEGTTSDERETSFMDMVKIALRAITR